MIGFAATYVLYRSLGILSCYPARMLAGNHVPYFFCLAGLFHSDEHLPGLVLIRISIPHLVNRSFNLV